MSQYSAKDGLLNDWHFAHFSKFAFGGVGLIFTESTKVERRGTSTYGDCGLWCDSQIAPLKRLTKFLRSQGSIPGIQLSHAGRKAAVRRPWEGFSPIPIEEHIGERDIIAPSPIAFQPHWPVPREMSLHDIQCVLTAWQEAARRANEADFDVLEIHGGHGYLIHQFLSPGSNQRKDRYGGNVTNRMRFALEVAQAVRANWPQHKPLFFRVSAVDELGWGIEDTVTLARALKDEGVDLMDCSSSGMKGSPTASGRALELGYQVPLAEQVRAEAAVRTMAVGLIVHPEQANDIVRQGHADLVAIGRELLRDPFWCHHASRTLGIDQHYDRYPKQYGWWLNKRQESGYVG